MCRRRTPARYIRTGGLRASYCACGQSFAPVFVRSRRCRRPSRLRCPLARPAPAPQAPASDPRRPDAAALLRPRSARRFSRGRWSGAPLEMRYLLAKPLGRPHRSSLFSISASVADRVDLAGASQPPPTVQVRRCAATLPALRAEGRPHPLRAARAPSSSRLRPRPDPADAPDRRSRLLRSGEAGKLVTSSEGDQFLSVSAADRGRPSPSARPSVPSSRHAARAARAGAARSGRPASARRRARRLARRSPSSTRHARAACARSATRSDARRTRRPAPARRRDPVAAARPRASRPAAARRAVRRC